MIFMVVLVGLLALLVLALGYRLWNLRRGGTAGILRDIPAVGGHGWSHGVVRYHGGRTAGSADAAWRSFRAERRAVTNSTS